MYKLTYTATLNKKKSFFITINIKTSQSIHAKFCIDICYDPGQVIVIFLKKKSIPRRVCDH